MYNIFFPILGILFINIGIIAFSLAVIFQLVTLPVEFNASRRAIQFLDTLGYDEETMYGAKKVLKAAAFTYVASTLAAILQVSRFVLHATRD